MKTLIFILLSLFLRLTCFSQSDNVKIVFEDAVRSLEEVNTIIYVDSSMNFYGKVGDFTKKGDLKGYFDTTKVVLHLQKSEIRYLNSKFLVDTSFAWPENMFSNSLMTSLDSANYYRLKLMKEHTERKIKRYFHFSRVVYFRNNSLSVFRLAEMYNPSGGNDYLFFYQKVDNQWKRYMKVYMGAW